MKVKIEKLERGPLKIELATDTKSKPVVFTLDKGKVDSLVQMLDAARRVERFKFELEV